MKYLTSHLRDLQNEKTEFIMVGDFNIAHHEIDIKNHSGNRTKAGFLPQERIWLDLWFSQAGSDIANLDLYLYDEKIDYYAPKSPLEQFQKGALGLHDLLREQCPDEEVYTWWTYLGRAFDNNAGWRIDYQIATDYFAKRVTNVEVYKQPSYQQRYSDHAPIVVDFE
jgi:exodeoxyribonuclease-3